MSHGYTSHGHPCCGQCPVGGRPNMVARCGGVGMCKTCGTEASQMHGDCVFCRIVAGIERATIVSQWPDVIAIMPLSPVVAGHTLVLPRVHVADFVEDRYVTGMVMERAAELTAELGLAPANLITSAGREATQSVFHLHVHIVPRAENDGLALPWYSGKRKADKREPAEGTPT